MFDEIDQFLVWQQNNPVPILPSPENPHPDP